MLRPILAILLFAPAAVFGQSSQRTFTGTDESLIVHPMIPSDLIDMIRHSELILDGAVQRVLPAVEVLGSPIPETDAIVNVTTLFRGSIPGNSPQIVITQPGGELGNRRWTVNDDSLMAPDERYILFLSPDPRTPVPGSTRLPRYVVVGIWAGKFKVTDGVVNVSQYTPPRLAALSGEDLDSFLGRLRLRIRQPYTEADKNLPVFPGPPK